MQYANIGWHIECPLNPCTKLLSAALCTGPGKLVNTKLTCNLLPWLISSPSVHGLNLNTQFFFLAWSEGSGGPDYTLLSSLSSQITNRTATLGGSHVCPARSRASVGSNLPLQFLYMQRDPWAQQEKIHYNLTQPSRPGDAQQWQHQAQRSHDYLRRCAVIEVEFHNNYDVFSQSGRGRDGTIPENART